MNSRLDEYIALRNKSRRQFWFDLMKEWWQLYPWRLPDDQEPPADDAEKMEQLASAKQEDVKKKSEVEEKLQKVSSFEGFSRTPDE